MLIFDEKTHTYTLDGVVLPSVTEIIRFLNYDTAAQAKSWLRDVAADRGTRVHRYCMLYDYGELPDEIDADCTGHVKAYIAFCRDYKPEWEYIEKPFASAELGFAGTIDRYGLIDGEIVLLDIKTGATLNYTAVAAQLTAYTALARLVFSPTLYSLQLRKDGTYKLVEHKPEKALFNACMTLHQALQKGKKHGK